MASGWSAPCWLALAALALGLVGAWWWWITQTSAVPEQPVAPEPVSVPAAEAASPAATVPPVAAPAKPAVEPSAPEPAVAGDVPVGVDLPSETARQKAEARDHSSRRSGKQPATARDSEPAGPEPEPEPERKGAVKGRAGELAPDEF